MKHDAYLEAMNFRFACKKFNKDKKIPCDSFEAILESGRLAPSSFGLEPTRVLVIRDMALREKIKSVCWNQSQITDCSELLIFTSLKCDMLPHTNYIFNKFARRVKTQEEIKQYALERYGKRKLDTLGYISDYDKLGLWSGHQAYIMATTIMNHAAFLRIDSCMIEGFDKKEIESILDIDSFKEQVTLVLCLGYRDMEQTPRLRMDLHDIVKFL